MTQDKRVEITHRILANMELLLINKIDGSDIASVWETLKPTIEHILTQYHQDISTALVKALEGLKVPLKECGVCNACEVAMHCTTAEAHLKANQVLTEAQNIIRTLLESKN